MWHAATVAARSVGYQGAGTVEFLVDGSDFYFLEMNTRLQVEHGVTELVTGLDLVGLQLLVASGQPLPLAQEHVTVSGHAVEARLCAERPREGYRPTPGTARHVAWPEGAGLRTDAGIESGSTVSSSYDSLVAKVMAHGGSQGDGDRAAWPGRWPHSRWTASRPIATSSAAILDDPVFRRGEAGIDYLDGRDDLRDAVPADDVRHRHAAAAALALLRRRAADSLVPVPAAGWRNVGVAAPCRHPRRCPGDARRPHQGTGRRRGGARRRRMGGGGDRHRHRRCRRPHLGRPTAALPRAPGRAARRRQRARGPVHVHPPERGRSGRAGAGRRESAGLRCPVPSPGSWWRWATSSTTATGWWCWRP